VLHGQADGVHDRGDDRVSELATVGDIDNAVAVSSSERQAGVVI
jgi:hypothetical protein